MANTKVLAVAAVAILCIAGVGYLAVSMGLFDEEPVIVDDSRLMVYGNANGDNRINDDDIKVLNKIISGDLEKTKYADANQDGVIDQKDVDYVRGIIDKTVDRVYISNTYDGVESAESCKYPLKSACVVGYDAIKIMKDIGAKDKINCLSGAKGARFNARFYSDVYDLPKVGPDVWKVNIEELSKQSVDSVVAMDGANYLKNHDLVRKAQIDVVRVEAAHPVNSLKGAITLGFLFECEEGAGELVKFYDGIAEEIAERVKHIEYEDRKTCLFATVSSHVEGPTSPYTQNIEAAGGRAIADAEGWGDGVIRKQFKEGDEWLLRYQSEFIVFSHSLGFEDIDVVEKYNRYSAYFEKMDAYKNGKYYIIDLSMSPSLRIAFMAQFFYPEIFGEDFAYDCLQEYFDRFVKNVTGFDAHTQGVWYINRDTLPAT